MPNKFDNNKYLKDENNRTINPFTVSDNVLFEDKVSLTTKLRVMERELTSILKGKVPLDEYNSTISSIRALVDGKVDDASYTTTIEEVIRRLALIEQVTGVVPSNIKELLSQIRKELDTITPKVTSNSNSIKQLVEDVTIVENLAREAYKDSQKVSADMSVVKVDTEEIRVSQAQINEELANLRDADFKQGLKNVELIEKDKELLEEIIKVKAKNSAQDDEIARTNASIRETNSNVGANKASIDELKAKNITQDSDIRKVEREGREEVERVEVKVDANALEIANIKSTHASDMNSINVAIDTINTTIDTSINTALEEVDANITELQGNMNTALTTKVDKVSGKDLVSNSDIAQITTNKNSISALDVELDKNIATINASIEALSEEIVGLTPVRYDISASSFSLNTQTGLYEYPFRHNKNLTLENVDIKFYDSSNELVVLGYDYVDVNSLLIYTDEPASITIVLGESVRGGGALDKIKYYDKTEIDAKIDPITSQLAKKATAIPNENDSLNKLKTDIVTLTEKENGLFLENGIYNLSGYLTVDKDIELSGNNVKITRNPVGNGLVAHLNGDKKLKLKDGVRFDKYLPQTSRNNKIATNSIDCNHQLKKDYNLVDDLISSIPANKIISKLVDNGGNNIIYALTKNLDKINFYIFSVLNSNGEVDNSSNSVGGVCTRVRNSKILANLNMYAWTKLKSSNLTVFEGQVADDLLTSIGNRVTGEYIYPSQVNMRTIHPATTFKIKDKSITNLIFSTGTGASEAIEIKVKGQVIDTINLKVASADLEKIYIYELPYPVNEVEINHQAGYTRVLGYNSYNESARNFTNCDELFVYGNPDKPYLDKPEINYAINFGKDNTQFKWAGGYHGGETRKSIETVFMNGSSSYKPKNDTWNLCDKFTCYQETALTHPQFTGDVIKVLSETSIDNLGYSIRYNYKFLQDVEVQRATSLMSSNMYNHCDMAYIPNFGVINMVGDEFGTAFINENSVLKYSSDKTKNLVVGNILLEGNEAHYNFENVDKLNNLWIQRYSPINVNKTYMWWICIEDTKKSVSIPTGFEKTFASRHILFNKRLPLV